MVGPAVMPGPTAASWKSITATEKSPGSWTNAASSPSQGLRMSRTATITMLTTTMTTRRARDGGEGDTWVELAEMTVALAELEWLSTILSVARTSSACWYRS